MAFLPYSYDHGQPMPFEYYPVAGGADIYVGQVMALDNGRLMVSSGDPAFISLREEASPAAGTVIPVMRITGGVVFEAPLAAAVAGLEPGSIASVGEDGLTISIDGGSQMEILSADGTAAGDLCRCRFIKE